MKFDLIRISTTTTNTKNDKKNENKNTPSEQLQTLRNKGQHRYS
jgi:hypothetical protein